MALLPMAPTDRIEIRMREVGEAVDFLDLAGIAEPVTIRHSRKRHPVRGDRPCLSLIFVGDVAIEGETGLNAWEVARRMTVDVQADIDVPSDDVTGRVRLGRFLAAYVGALRAEGSALLSLIDDVIEGDIDPEDRAQAEDGRLVRSLDLLYRVRRDDGNVLLTPEENA